MGQPFLIGANLSSPAALGNSSISTLELRPVSLCRCLCTDFGVGRQPTRIRPAFAFLAKRWATRADSETSPVVVDGGSAFT